MKIKKCTQKKREVLWLLLLLILAYSPLKMKEREN